MATMWTNEQLDAINKEGTNIIVSAGAGSGKTAVLTERVIRKLKSGVPITRLLILTFTNMASKEMKDRIRESIKNDESLKEQLNLLDTAFITTFDSYALSIVKKYHYKVGVSNNIEIAESSIIDLKKIELMDKIFDSFYCKDDALFIKLITDFCIKDDKEIKDYILTISNKLDMKYDKINYLNSYLDTYYSESFLDNMILEYTKLLNKIIDEIKELLTTISSYVDSNYYLKLETSMINLLNANDYDSIKNNINIKLPMIPRGTSEEVKKLKEEIKNNIDKLKEYAIYDNVNHIKETILLTKDYAKIIVSILLELDKELNDYKKENELYDFTDIAKLAIKIVSENNDIKEELKSCYNEIMIDEYQDTNDLQELFISNISNNNTYMVGDVKQSIYKFRNANLYIFKNKYDNYANLNGGIKIDLNKNFRSREEVISGINLIFDYIMNDNMGGASYKKEHRMIFGNLTYNAFKPKQNNSLEIYNYNADKRFSKEETEIFIIANDIINKIKNNYQVYDKNKKELRSVNYSDFVILVDRITNSYLYKKIFKYLNIPLIIYKDSVINDSIIYTVVRNIIGLIIKVHSKCYDEEFKYLYISIARSFLVEYKDDYIFDVVKDNKYYETSLFNKIKDIAKKIDYLTINDVLDLIIDDFNIYDNLIRIGSISDYLNDINYMKELFLRMNNYNLNELYDYLKGINDNKIDLKYLKVDNFTNGVKLMTIHRSKGLEYNICYYNMLFKEFNLRDVTDKFYYDNKYGIVMPYIDNGINRTIISKMVKDNYYNEEISERIRLFYVAMTRAKEKMIVIVNDIYEGDMKKRFKSFRDIILSIRDYLSTNITDYDISKINITRDYNYVKKDVYKVDNSNMLRVNELVIDNGYIEESSYSKKTNNIFSYDEKKLLEIGERIHYILEVIDLKNPNFDIIKDSFIRDKVSSLLSSDLFKNIGNAKIYKEYEFIYNHDSVKRHGIIDLMLEYDNYIDIIDYKLKNIDDPNYLKQLEGYMEYIKSISNKDVNIYLYSFIDKKYKKLN